MSDDVNVNNQGESEEDYYARVRAVPGIFNDRNESAQAVVDKADLNLAHAKALEENTSLAPKTAIIDADSEDKTYEDEDVTPGEYAAPVLTYDEVKVPAFDAANAQGPVATIEGDVENPQAEERVANQTEDAPAPVVGSPEHPVKDTEDAEIDKTEYPLVEDEDNADEESADTHL